MSQSAYTAQLLRPPSRQDVVASCPQLGIPACRPLLPFYSKEADRQADRQKDLKQAVAAELAAFAGARDSLDEQQAAAMGRTFGLVPQLGRSMTLPEQVFRLLSTVKKAWTAVRTTMNTNVAHPAKERCLW